MGQGEGVCGVWPAGGDAPEGVDSGTLPERRRPGGSPGHMLYCWPVPGATLWVVPNPLGGVNTMLGPNSGNNSTWGYPTDRLYTTVRWFAEGDARSFVGG